MLFIGIAMGSIYIPWMLVPRLTFIYHFFATVPFMILCITYVFMRFRDRFSHYRWAGVALYGYLVIALILFIMFYPILSGAEVDRHYVEAYLKWKASWRF